MSLVFWDYRKFGLHFGLFDEFSTIKLLVFQYLPEGGPAVEVTRGFLQLFIVEIFNLRSAKAMHFFIKGYLSD